MIRINLLPVRARKKKENIRQQVVVYAACLALTLGVTGYLYARNSSEIERLNTRIQTVEKEINKHKGLQNKIKKLLAQEKEVKKKLEIITSLKARRGRLVHMLDELSATIPQKKMWFNSIKETKGRISINGAAMNLIVIADFMRVLAASPWIEDQSVNLVTANKYKTKGIVLRKFTITCKLSPPKKKKEPEKKAEKS